MGMVAEAGDAGAVPVLRAEEFDRRGPFLRPDEDVPHDGALPDLYGLVADKVMEQAVERGLLRWAVNLRTGETVLTRSIQNSNR